MQILHTEKGDVAVVTGFQKDVNSPIIFETPDGKYIYRSQEVVPRSVLEEQGIVPPLKETLALNEVLLEKEYKSAGGASRAMFQRKLSKDDYVILPVQDSDGIESFVIRKKDSPEVAAFIQRGGGEKSGVIPIENTARAGEVKE